MRKVCLLAFLFCALSSVAQAQFNSGSTGADGALNLATMTCPNNVCEVQLPESGILNYTTVNIPQGKTLIFKRNLRNTPVIILAQGNVVIAGTIDVSAPYSSREPGPGGFRGGDVEKSGFGPGGENGQWVGNLSLVPIIGGSGSYGYRTSCCSFYGGGGGGGIVIASSSSVFISSSGSIKANGNVGNGVGNPPQYPTGGSSGSGGAIRLVSNSLDVSGRTEACGGSCGVIRFEATQRNFTGTSNPAPVLSTINPTIIPAAPPSLTIASIGGYTVPNYSGTRTDTVDLLLPTQLSDPINVVIQGRNVPTGTQVRLQFSGSNATTAPCTLSGTEANSSATCTISNLNRSAVTYILAVATFNPPAFAEFFNPKGKNYVANVKLETALGGKPKYIFLGADGKQIETKNLSTQFLQQFGM